MLDYLHSAFRIEHSDNARRTVVDDEILHVSEDIGISFVQ